MSDSFFSTDDGYWFTPTSHTRGPWDSSACHAGPPTGLMVRAMERLIPLQRLCRITVNLQRPIPFDGFTVTANIERKGRTLSLVACTVTDGDARLIATAQGLFLTPLSSDNQLPVSADVPHFGSPADALPDAFPISPVHDEDSFAGTGVQLRFPKGETPVPGPTTLWMKTVPLLPDETPSPFQKISPLADCGNAFGRLAEPDEISFMNADLTVVLFREPHGEWLGSESIGYWQPDGIGLADARLFDATGVVGRAVQTLVLR